MQWINTITNIAMEKSKNLMVKQWKLLKLKDLLHLDFWGIVAIKKAITIWTTATLFLIFSFSFLLLPCSIDFFVFLHLYFSKSSVSPSAKLNIYKVCAQLYDDVLKGFCCNKTCWWACWDSLDMHAFVRSLAKCWFCCCLLFPLSLSILYPLFLIRCMKEELILSSLWLASCWRNQPIKSSPCWTL